MVSVMTFTIDSENNITAHAGSLSGADESVFSNQKELAKLAAGWPVDCCGSSPSGLVMYLPSFSNWTVKV
jgi:hypothetical protein